MPILTRQRPERKGRLLTGLWLAELGGMESSLTHRTRIEKELEHPSTQPALRHIESAMSRSIVSVPPDMKVEEAVDLMVKREVRHIPVVENGRMIGLITDRLVRMASALEERTLLTVSDVMILQPYCVGPDTPLYRVCLDMAENRHGYAMVVDSLQRPLGVFTSVDALRILGEWVAHAELQRSRARGGRAA
jgi:acetoin utilization protein AcuB